MREEIINVLFMKIVLVDGVELSGSIYASRTFASRLIVASPWAGM